NEALDTGTVATYATTSKGGRRLVDLISEKEDSDLSVKGKKDKKIAKKAAAPAPEEKNDNDGEMKVAWKEKPQAEKSAKPQTDLDSSIKSDPEYRSRLTEASDLQPAKEEGAKAEKTDLAMIEKTPSPKSDLPPDLAGGQNSESSPKSAENTNVDDRINKALGQVGAEKSDVATADDSEGAVRVKSSWEDPKTAKKDLKSKKEKSAPVAKSHLVKKGETLASIAEKYGVSIADLRSWNKMSPKKELLWGQKLKIETASSKEAEEPSDNKFAKAPQNKAITTKTEKNEKSLKTAKAPAAKVIAYKVKKGDTINKIAKRYDLTPHEILGFNGIKNGAIRPGLVLKIPASKSKG
ncbi:MAG: LysM peptidoglycan-binding domain-containing protein, partial [Deltaproteobacteria bacterium]|nr:LysM peptidoglycan-binding domain-containing protein [Deltaproteobacteria bacterium]